AHPAVNGVRVIIHPDDHVHYAAATAGLALLAPVAGGAQRQDSVRNGLESLADDPPHLVLIHDGARPFLDRGVIDRVLAGPAERAGIAVALVEGSEDNFKVTTMDDLARAERLLAARCGDIRTGQGFDVHVFGPGDHIWLCGVAVPHSHGLVGHSDADVGLHALTDAVLGAVGDGDIGMHFPPSDPQWRGAPSHRFLRHAADRVAATGGTIAHVDVTVIC